MTPRPAPPPREAAVLAACMRVLELRGCVVHRRNTGAMRAEYGGRGRVVRFGEPGAADVWFVMPDGAHGELEVKRPGGRPTLDQVRWLLAHNGIGRSVAFWADNAATVARVVEHVAAGGRVVYLAATREYRDRRGRVVAGPDGDYNLG